MASSQFHDWWSRFSATGNISPIELGFTSAQVREILGEPDDLSVEKQGREPAILKYDAVEFHFGTKIDDPLWLIFMDTDDRGVRVSISRLVEPTAP